MLPNLVVVVALVKEIHFYQAVSSLTPRFLSLFSEWGALWKGTARTPIIMGRFHLASTLQILFKTETGLKEFRKEKWLWEGMGWS